MTHVFSLEAIATCEQRGHVFAWVETWHGIGFDECSRCGATGATRERSAGILPGAAVDAPAYDWDGLRTHDVGQWQVVTPRDLAKPGGHVFSVASPSRQPAAEPAPRYADATDPAAAKPVFAGRPNPNADRDEQIRARAAAGEPHRAIAQAFGVHQSRVTQILRGKRPPKASGEHAERDADVRRRMAAGESVKAIALAHGISPARVYQIAPARAGASQ